LEEVQKSDLRVDISYGQIFKMAIPISFAILIPQFNFIVNNIFLGHYSPDVMATAGITGVYYLIFTAIGYGLNNGLQTLIAKRAGENKPDEIGLVFNQGVLISLVIAAFGMLLTWAIIPQLFKIMLHDVGRQNQAIQFLNIRMWGLPFLYIYQMRNALLVGTNQSRFLVAGTLTECAANIFFDYVFIFGHWGFPELGFNGAAYASVIAEFVGMFVIYLVIRREGMIQRFGLFSSLSIHKRVAYEILNFSFPLIFQQACSIASWVYFFILLENQGTTSLQVSNAMRNVFGLFGSASWAFAATTNSMVSNILGQRLFPLFWKLIARISWISLSFTFVVCVVLNLFPIQFLSLFGQNKDFYDAGVPTIRVVSLAMFLMSISSIFLNALVATGNTRVSLFAEIFSLIIYVLYVYWALKIENLPVYLAWISEWIYWIFLLLPCALFLIFGNWRSKYNIENQI